MSLKLSKKAKIATIALAFTPLLAQADLIKGSVDIGLYSPSKVKVDNNEFGSKNAITAHASIEHAIPLIPNVRLDTTFIKTSTYGYGLSSGTAYYNFLNNDAVHVKSGLGMSFLHSGVLGSKNGIFKFNIPMGHAYLEADVSLPFTNGLSVYANVFKYKGHNTSGTDSRAGIKYAWNIYGVKPSISAGYRKMQFDLNHIDSNLRALSNQGVFFNVGVAI